MPLTTGPVALTIAGFDPSSGAGVTGDLKTMAAYGVYGASCITALTVQNTTGVLDLQATEPDLVRATLNAIADDLPIRGAKIGMLATAWIAQEVVDFLAKHELGPVVVDPVLASSSGFSLLEANGRRVMLEGIMARADVFTPNAMEAGELTGQPVNTVEEAMAAGEKLLELGARAVVVKGGHLAGNSTKSIDILIQRNAGPSLYTGPRIETASTHGTGCAFSTAILCELLRGKALDEAVRGAKHYTFEALRAARPLGRGSGPLEHFWRK